MEARQPTFPLFTPFTSPNQVTKSNKHQNNASKASKPRRCYYCLCRSPRFPITFQLLCLVWFRFPDFPAFCLFLGLWCSPMPAQATPRKTAPIPDRVQNPRHETCFEPTRSRDGAVTSAALAASRYRGHRPSEVTCFPRRGARPVSLETRPQVRTGYATPPRVVLASGWKRTTNQGERGRDSEIRPLGLSAVCLRLQGTAGQRPSLGTMLDQNTDHRIRAGNALERHRPEPDTSSQAEHRPAMPQPTSLLLRCEDIPRPPSSPGARLR